MPINHIELGMPVINLTNYNLDVFGQTDTTVVAAGAYKIRQYTPDVNKLWKCYALYLEAPAVAGATAGTHSFVIRSASAKIISGVAPFNADLIWDSSCWQNTSSQLPTTESASLTALFKAIWSSDIPIQILYYNDTDAATSSNREIQLHMKETNEI